MAGGSGAAAPSSSRSAVLASRTLQSVDVTEMTIIPPWLTDGERQEQRAGLQCNPDTDDAAILKAEAAPVLNLLRLVTADAKRYLAAFLG
jgi:hypothetical protein